MWHIKRRRGRHGWRGVGWARMAPTGLRTMPPVHATYRPAVFRALGKWKCKYFVDRRMAKWLGVFLENIAGHARPNRERKREIQVEVFTNKSNSRSEKFPVPQVLFELFRTGNGKLGGGGGWGKHSVMNTQTILTIIYKVTWNTWITYIDWYSWIVADGKS